jgi:hypothetical protein
MDIVIIKVGVSNQLIAKAGGRSHDYARGHNVSGLLFGSNSSVDEIATRVSTSYLPMHDYSSNPHLGDSWPSLARYGQ